MSRRASRGRTSTSRKPSTRSRTADLPLSGGPDLLCGPLPSPLRAHVAVVVVLLRVGSRVHVDEPLDPEAVPLQEVDPVAMREVILDADLVRPLIAIHAVQ